MITVTISTTSSAAWPVHTTVKTNSCPCVQAIISAMLTHTSKYLNVELTNEAGLVSKLRLRTSDGWSVIADGNKAMTPELEWTAALKTQWTQLMLGGG